MAPAYAVYVRSVLTHALNARQPSPDSIDALGPLEASKRLLARDDTTATRPDPEAGVVHPGDINNKAIFALFGLLGVAFVCTGIWFFFWAKNGGFYFKEDDWDDYKTTVLRRKGPNGTTLSGATTEITDLGGGSVYKDIHDDDDGSTEVTGITGGVSDVVGREKKRRRREQKERDKERRREEKRREKENYKKNKKSNKESASKRKVGEDGAVIDEDAEAEAQQYLRNYRHEKPARVGGLNRESEASTWDGSTNPTDSSRGGSSVTSELINHRERTPTSSPTKKSSTPAEASGSRGIRKVYSTADKRDSRETERIRAEARKLQEKGRAAAASSSGGGGGGHRRNFSWQRDNQITEDTAMMSDIPPSYTASEVDTRIPGSWGPESDVGTDVGTKAYHHVIPGLSSSGAGSSAGGTDVRDYADERRKNRRSAGYRRER